MNRDAPLIFTWDDRKAWRVERDRHISFEEAATVFADPLSVTEPDRDHSQAEDRWHITGQSNVGRLLRVTYIERDGGAVIHIITVWLATTAERRQYEEGA
jgi:uncharacterized protein